MWTPEWVEAEGSQLSPSPFSPDYLVLGSVSSPQTSICSC